MDRHLNIFEFFNDSNYERYEDNMSRAFALCLKFDMLFLDNVLRQVLDSKLYDSLFNVDFPDYHIDIDLQKKPNELENFSTIIAIACSGVEIDFSKIDGIKARETQSPETDVVVEINDTCLIFEFKISNEDCSSQLKCQAEKIKALGTKDTVIRYVDFNWSKIVKSLLNALSIQRQINSENHFTRDFTRFIENRHPNWFPTRLLSNIPFPRTEDEPNRYQLDSRLDQIKVQIFGQERTKEIIGKHNRLVLTTADWGWAKEIHVGSYGDKSEGDFITIEIYPGDTKGQGRHFFKPNRSAIEWPSSLEGYELEATPYLKFSHFNSGLFWYIPTKNEYEITHTRTFFEKNAGKYHRQDWPAFESLMNSIAPTWRTNCGYDSEIISSNRTYFDLSIGVSLAVYIPYKDAQKLDSIDLNSPIARKLAELINSLKDLIEKS